MTQTRPKSMIPPAAVEGLRGSLSLTSVFDLLQFLNVSGKTGQLLIEKHPERLEGRAYFAAGAMVHATAPDCAGMDALVEVCTWDQGSFAFYDNVLSPNVSITMPVQHALMEAVRIHDERRRTKAMAERPDQERGEVMPNNARSSTDVLEDFLKVPGVLSAVVIGRDGFLIEAAGGTTAVNTEDLGAALAHAINGIEEMGGELHVNKFQDLFVEYGRAVIMCRPVGDAIMAVVAPDASKLGIIRHKVKPLVEELANYF
jgi:predicted regulator of Ras-like GTPase activity (Roadblock/LC7/MglB family)